MSNTPQPAATLPPQTTLLLTRELAAQSAAIAALSKRVSALESALSEAEKPSPSGPTLAEVVKMLDALESRMDRAVDEAGFAATDARKAAEMAKEEARKASSAALHASMATRETKEQTEFLKTHEPATLGGWRVKKGD